MSTKLQELFNQAEDGYKSDNLTQALSLYTQIVEAEPDNFAARKRVIEIYLIQGKFETATRQAMQHLEQKITAKVECVLNMMILISERLSGEFIEGTGLASEIVSDTLEKLKDKVVFDLDLLMDRLEKKYKADEEKLDIIKQFRYRLNPHTRQLWDWYFDMSHKLTDKSGLNDVLIYYQELKGIRYGLLVKEGKLFIDYSKLESTHQEQEISLHNLYKIAYAYYDSLLKLTAGLGIEFTQPREDFLEKQHELKALYCYQNITVWDMRGRRDSERVMLQVVPDQGDGQAGIYTLSGIEIQMEDLTFNFQKRVKTLLTEKICHCPACRAQREKVQKAAYKEICSIGKIGFIWKENDLKKLNTALDAAFQSGWMDRWQELLFNRSLHLDDSEDPQILDSVIKDYELLAEKGDDPFYFLKKKAELLLRIGKEDESWECLVKLSCGIMSDIPWFREQWEAGLKQAKSKSGVKQKKEALENLVENLANKAESILDLREKIAIKRADVEDYQELADYYHKQRIFDKAMEVYQSIFTHCKHYGYPRASIYCHQIGDCLTELGRYEEALQYFDKAMQYNDHNPMPFCGKSLALIYLKRNAEAKKILETGMAISPEMDNEIRGVWKTLKAQMLIKGIKW